MATIVQEKYVLIFTKNDFWYYVYVKFNIFSVKYTVEKMPFWAADRFLFKCGFLELYLNDETQWLANSNRDTWLDLDK